MGEDCCGGSAAADQAADAAVHAQQQLKDLYVTGGQPAGNGTPAAAPNGAAPAKPDAKSDADTVKEKLPYFKQRIELFEKYQQRELQKVEDAKAANVSLKGTHAPNTFAPHLPRRRAASSSRGSRHCNASLQQMLHRCMRFPSALCGPLSDL